MKQLQSMEAMLSYPAFYLPKLLSLHGAELTQARSFAMADKPALVYAAVMAHLCSNPRSRGQAQLIREMRHLKVNPQGGRAESQRIFRVGGVHGATEPFWARLLDSAHLYVDEDGKIVSRIVSTFGYEPDGDYEGELELYRQVECPECGAVEVAFHDEDMLESLSRFTHLTGPYCRCRQCDTAVRPTISPATSLPSNAEYGDPEAWDYYVEWLEENLETMANHVSRFGRPHNLFITGTNLDWRGRSGEASCDFTGNALADKLKVNGDFCIRNGKLWLEQDGTASMTCTMYHHDAPTGSSITITPTWTCELDTDYSIEMSEMTDNTKRCQVAELMLCGDDRVFEYTDGASFMLVSESGLLTGLEWLASQLEVDQWGDVTPSDSWTPADALQASIGWHLETLIDQIRCKNAYSVDRVKYLRGLIDVYLAHQGEE